MCFVVYYIYVLRWFLNKVYVDCVDVVDVYDGFLYLVWYFVCDWVVWCG